MTKSKLEKDKSFQAPADENALSAHFDVHNGDFDTPEEFIRAYLNGDTRALAALSLQNMEELRDVLENMHYDIQDQMAEGQVTPEKMKQYLDDVARRERSPKAPT